MSTAEQIPQAPTEQSTDTGEHSEIREVIRHLLKNRGAVVGLVIIGVFLVAALFAPVLATHSPTDTSLVNRLQQVSTAHWLGTDELGDRKSTRLNSSHYS